MKKRTTWCTLVALVVVMGALRGVEAHPPHMHAERGDVDERTRNTLAFFRARLEANPGDTISLSRLAGLELDAARRTKRHGDFERAEASFRKLAALDASSRVSDRGLAYALSGQHRFAEALEAARRVAATRPDDPQSWALLGDMHLALGHHVEAEALFRRLVEHELTVEWLSRMALVHQESGRYDEARRAWAETLEVADLLDAPDAVRRWCRTTLGELEEACTHPAARR